MKKTDTISILRVIYELLVLKKPDNFHEFKKGVIKRFNTLYSK